MRSGRRRWTRAPRPRASLLRATARRPPEGRRLSRILTRTRLDPDAGQTMHYRRADDAPLGAHWRRSVTPSALGASGRTRGIGDDGGGGPGAPPSRGGARCRLTGQRRPGLHDADAHLGRRPRRGARGRHALPALARQSAPRRGDRREAAARERRGGSCVTGDRHAGRQVGRVPRPGRPAQSGRRGARARTRMGRTGRW